LKNYLSIGDFQDLFHKINSKDFFSILSRLNIFPKKRVKYIWNQNINLNSGWWIIPQVNKRLNKFISGNSEINYQDYFIKKFLSNKKDLILLSPGCGTGSKEKIYAKHSQFKLIECFDISLNRINNAKKSLVDKKITNMHFSVQDLSTFVFKEEYYDVIVFDMILHHVKNVRTILKKVKNSLKKDGFLVINEYVGPNRFQFSNEQLNVSNRTFENIPLKYKKIFKSNSLKTKIYKPGILRMILSDHTEAVNSDQILPVLNDMFTLIEHKPYGGNILHLIFNKIAHNFIDDGKETNKLLNYIFSEEDEFLHSIKQSDFVFSVFVK